MIQSGKLWIHPRNYGRKHLDFMTFQADKK